MHQGNIVVGKHNQNSFPCQTVGKTCQSYVVFLQKTCFGVVGKVCGIAYGNVWRVKVYEIPGPDVAAGFFKVTAADVYIGIPEIGADVPEIFRIYG